MTEDVLDDDAIDEDLDLAGLQGRERLSTDWTTRIVCCDVLDLKRRHVCRMCERKLPPRRVYCSESCRLVFEQDHFWGLARARALKRAKIAGAILLAPLAPQLWTLEDLEAGHNRRRLAAELRRRIDDGASRIRRVTIWRCAKCQGGTEEPEVNHIRPVVGGNRSVTCLNHEENLEVLCHVCHLGETAAQRQARQAVVT